ADPRGPGRGEGDDGEAGVGVLADGEAAAVGEPRGAVDHGDQGGAAVARGERGRAGVLGLGVDDRLGLRGRGWGREEGGAAVEAVEGELVLDGKVARGGGGVGAGGAGACTQKCGQKGSGGEEGEGDAGGGDGRGDDAGAC